MNKHILKGLHLESLRVSTRGILQAETCILWTMLMLFNLPTYWCMWSTYKQVMASKTKIFIVLEYVDGGELFDKIVRFYYFHVYVSSILAIFTENKNLAAQNGEKRISKRTKSIVALSIFHTQFVLLYLITGCYMLWTWYIIVLLILGPTRETQWSWGQGILPAAHECCGLLPQ